MRVLFDQCTPEALRKELPGHDIQTANEAGVSDLENGDLIDEAVRRGYDLLVTADRRMQKQEEIKGKPLRVVVLTRPDWSKVEKQIHEVREAIATAEPGKFTRVIARKTEPQPRLKFEERDDGLFDLTEDARKPAPKTDAATRGNDPGRTGVASGRKADSERRRSPAGTRSARRLQATPLTGSRAVRTIGRPGECAGSRPRP